MTYTREVQKDTFAISEKLPNAISKLPRSVFSRVIDDNWGLLRIVPIVHKTTKVAPCGSLARLDAKLLVTLHFQKVTPIHCKVKAKDTKSWVDNAINKVTKNIKHCQRHNGPEGWVLLTKVTSLGHITNSHTNLDQTSWESQQQNNDKTSASKFSLNINFEILP